MGTVKIINNSTLTDYAAVMRVGMFMADDERTTLNERLEKTTCIRQKGMTFIVTDFEQKFCRYRPHENTDTCKGCEMGCLSKKPAAYINRDFEDAIKEMESHGIF